MKATPDLAVHYFQAGCLAPMSTQAAARTSVTCVQPVWVCFAVA